MVLKVKWEDFKSEVEDFKSKGDALIEKHIFSRTEDEFNNFKKEKTILGKCCGQLCARII
ncbi:hypothetical protein [Gelidibacter japonicus]|uniref:hypothetical protein n=1 Tax=Gelidibacter japonicus TaxID=1962232 RepID=UPI002AFFCF6C|nr:hypothetical protein [Gelidibacter japonicus]